MLIKIADKEYNEQELEVLNKAGVLQIGQKNDPASTTLTAQTLHGQFHGSTTQFGLLSQAGARPQRFSALSRPGSWLDIVNVNGNDVEQEIIEILTGQLASGTSNASGFCGNPPVAGDLKVCSQTYSWGDFYVKTDLNALAMIGSRRNRADMPGQIMNAADANNPFLPDVVTRISDTRSQLALELFRLGNGAERSTEVVSIQGSAGVDNSRFGWFHEFAGLNAQIKTGYVDSKSGYACGATDSVVESFNAIITGNSADGSSRNFTAVLFDALYALRDRALQVGMGGVVWAVVMRHEQFRRAVEVLSSQYNSYAVTGAQYAERNSTGDFVQQIRREMLAGSYLLDDMGQQVPVIFTEGLDNSATAANTYNADILIVPVSWNGTPLIRLEYFDMNNSYIDEFVSYVRPDTVKVINNGMYLVGQRDTGLCMEFHFQARMRLILEAPFLAGRIDDVQYTYYAKTRQAIPGSSLAVNGGISYRT